MKSGNGLCRLGSRQQPLYFSAVIERTLSGSITTKKRRAPENFERRDPRRDQENTKAPARRSIPHLLLGPCRISGLVQQDLPGRATTSSASAAGAEDRREENGGRDRDERVKSRSSARPGGEVGRGLHRKHDDSSSYGHTAPPRRVWLSRSCEAVAASSSVQ